MTSQEGLSENGPMTMPREYLRTARKGADLSTEAVGTQSKGSAVRLDPDTAVLENRPDDDLQSSTEQCQHRAVAAAQSSGSTEQWQHAAQAAQHRAVAAHSKTEQVTARIVVADSAAGRLSGPSWWRQSG